MAGEARVHRVEPDVFHYAFVLVSSKMVLMSRPAARFHAQARLQPQT